MFDFTRQVNLEKKYLSIYKKMQIFLYFFAFLSSLYFAYLILFPNAYFAFDFATPNSLKNTIISPRNSEEQYVEHGKIDPDGKLIFDTALVGNYGKANIKLRMDKQSENPENLEIKSKKSFRAFFYPTGEPIASKDATLFKIDGNYYMFTDGKLRKFLSQNAYLSNYDENAAVQKDKSFINQYPLDENMIGYADGTLISYGISAFIVSSGKILPINNTTTFSAMGYDWKDVRQASADEISFYEKDKLFTLSSAHPDGTILVTSDTKKGYLIENETKRPIQNDKTLKSLGKISPISVSERSLDTIGSCNLEKEALSFRTYSCDINLLKFNDLIGKDYEFYLDSDKKIKIDLINVTFKKQISWSNLKTTIGDLINKIMANYGIGETTQ